VDNNQGGNNEQGGGNFGYCDYGPVTQWGGGCFAMEHENDCDLEWGQVVNSCPGTTPSSSSEANQEGNGSTPSSSSGCTAANNTSTQYCSEGTMKTYGTITDSRDGKKYKTVEIGSQIWMAENLNYKVEIQFCIGTHCSTDRSRCEDEDDNCSKCGMLYSWAMAMNLPLGNLFNNSDSCNDKSCSNQISAKHRGICPEGWHISTAGEWNDLKRDAVRNYHNEAYGDLITYGTVYAGKYLKATSGWNDNGEDTYGFAALPCGSGKGFWWTANEQFESNAKHNAHYIEMTGDALLMGTRYKGSYQSVRCVKD
jgi:uncharacterized protein (TIGR02145 family)